MSPVGLRDEVAEPFPSRALHATPSLRVLYELSPVGRPSPRLIAQQSRLPAVRDWAARNVLAAPEVRWMRVRPKELDRSPCEWPPGLVRDPDTHFAAYPPKRIRPAPQRANGRTPRRRIAAIKHTPRVRRKLLLLGAGTVLRAVAHSALVAATVIPTACFTTHGFLLVLVDTSLKESKAMSGIPVVAVADGSAPELSSRNLNEARCSVKIPNTGRRDGFLRSRRDLFHHRNRRAANVVLRRRSAPPARCQA
jgi:hypothetical protein